MDQPDTNHDAMDTVAVEVPSSPVFAPSSPDPLAVAGLNHSQPPPARAGTASRPIQTSDFAPTSSVSRKRTTATRNVSPAAARQPPTLDHFEFTSQRLASMPKAKSAEEAIDMARNLVIQASLLTSGIEHKKLLDLLEVFRDYTEKNRVNNHGLAVLTSQVSNLETVSRTIGSKVKLLQKPTAATPISNSQPSSINPTPAQKAPSYAAAAAKAPAPAADWHVVGKKKSPEPTVRNKLSSRQLVLTRNTFTPFDSLRLRNEFNDLFARKGLTTPVVASVTTSAKQNMVVTTTPRFTAKYLLENINIWENITPFTSALLNESWHKVAVHNVPTSYDSNEDLSIIKTEIETFNKGLKVVGNPYWLTKPDRRRQQETGTICVAFATEREAQQAIRNRLYVLGISVRAEKLHATPPTSQCAKCQRFGHSDTRCSNEYTCKICAGHHATRVHKCNTCNVKGRACMHTIPLCGNCKGPHTADSKLCEIFQAKLHPRREPEAEETNIGGQRFGGFYDEEELDNATRNAGWYNEDGLANASRDAPW